MQKKIEVAAKSVMLLGVRVDDISLEQLLNQFVDAFSETDKTIISYVNIHAMNLAYKNRRFNSFINKSNVVLCDGFGVKYAVFFVHKRKIHRYTPPDFIDLVCELAVKHNKRIFFLGGRQGVAAKAAFQLTEKYPALIVENYHGYFDKTFGSDENQDVIQRINAHKADILIVGFGMPLQEEWIEQNIGMLDAKVLFSAGAIFDYLSGELTRMPRWLTNHGFEWLGRLAIEPRRLWKRYIIGNPLFVWRLFVHYILGISLPQ